MVKWSSYLCFTQMMGLILLAVSLEGGDSNGGVCLFFPSLIYTQLYYCQNTA